MLLLFCEQVHFPYLLQYAFYNQNATYFPECTSGSHLFSLFFVEDRDSINVESTIVPFFNISFRSVRISTTFAKIFSCNPFSVKILRNLPIVSPFGISAEELIPQKSENARLYDFNKFFQWNDCFRSVQKILFVGSGCTKLIIYFCQSHLPFHISIISYFFTFCNCAVLP